MSTENRVESNLSALIARRSFRQPIDNAGMGFHEELLSLTFESQTEFVDLAVDSKNASSSVDQNPNGSDETNPASEEENDRPEKEIQNFAFPIPLPQQPVNNTQSQESDLVLAPENPVGPESVKGSLSADNSKVASERSLPSHRTQPNDLGPHQVSTEQGNQKTSTTFEKSKASPEHSATNDGAELNQTLKPDADTGLLIDANSSMIQRESKKPVKNVSQDVNRGGLAQAVEASESNVAAADRVVRIDETVSGQDSLLHEQDTAPTRGRRTSRQDRIREENGEDAKRDSLESKQTKDKELGTSSATESNGQNSDSNLPSNQLNGIVLQPPPAGAVETNYSVAGQAVVSQSDTVVVNGASNAGAASATITAGIASARENVGTTESGSVQPLVAGSGRGDSSASSSTGTGRAEGSTGSSSLSRFQQNKLVQRVLNGLEQLSSGGGQVKLRLHPPELGTLQMTLKIEANVMSAHLEVENSLAKDALLNNLQGLRDRLSEQGMSIDRFEVEVRTDSQSGTSSSSGESESNRQSRRDQPESRYAIYNENRLIGDTVDEGKPSVSWFRTTGKLDLSV
ncbi:MAG: flagellar hook-length control protein FliK [Pirellula sp.]|jgi:flagellar hook-length control protein FliK